MKNELKVKVKGRCMGPDGNLHRINKRYKGIGVMVFANEEFQLTGGILGGWSIISMAAMLEAMIKNQGAYRFNAALELAREELAKDDAEAEEEKQED